MQVGFALGYPVKAFFTRGLPRWRGEIQGSENPGNLFVRFCHFACVPFGDRMSIA